MQVYGWRSEHADTSTGAGFGVLISRVDRDTYFRRNWKCVQLELEEEPHVVNIKLTKLFWNRNLYIHHPAIGLWFIKHGYNNWDVDDPPEMQLVLVKDNHFRLSLPY